MTEFEIMTLIDIAIDFEFISAKLSPRRGDLAIDIDDDIQHPAASPAYDLPVFGRPTQLRSHVSMQPY
jgi:hypothetical protein